MTLEALLLQLPVFEESNSGGAKRRMLDEFLTGRTVCPSACAGDVFFLQSFQHFLHSLLIGV